MPRRAFSIASASNATTATLEYQNIFSEQTELDIKAFGGYLSRYSKRQRGGGVGVMPIRIPHPDRPRAPTPSRCAKIGPRARNCGCATTTPWPVTFPPSPAACISTTPCRIAATIAVSLRMRTAVCSRRFYYRGNLGPRYFRREPFPLRAVLGYARDASRVYPAESRRDLQRHQAADNLLSRWTTSPLSRCLVWAWITSW